MTEPESVESLAFEVAFQELEEIVARLEQEEHTLEESLQLFERGQSLARHCARLLEQAELKVQQIIQDDLVDFEGES
jgi:exodeoxyribonuclease VII small subunit